MITAATQMFFTSVLDAKLATFQATDLSNTGEEGAGIGGGGGGGLSQLPLKSRPLVEFTR